MKIAISSDPTRCTQVLTESLAKENQLTVIADPSPQLCRSLGYQTLYDLPLAAQFQVREQLLNEHHQMVQHRDNVIFEFSIIEWCADWCRWLWSHTSTDHWQRIVVLATDIVSQYDTIYFPTEGSKTEYDGYHWLDARNAEQIQSLLPYISSLLGCNDKIKKIQL